MGRESLGLGDRISEDHLMGHTGPLPERRVILAIDPGTNQSGFVLWDGSVLESGMLDNQDLLSRLQDVHSWKPSVVAIEMIASYGMAVGKEVFDTCVWIGRFTERAGAPVHLLFRRDIKIHLCGTAKAKDANIRMALIDKHGTPGTKKQPGRTYGISGNLWAALAVADYARSLNL
jgi:hypothetical protein